MVDFESKTVFYTFVIGLAILSTLQVSIFLVTDHEVHSKISEETEEVFDQNARISHLIDVIPNCVKSCIFPRITDIGCAHSDYPCLCRNFHELEDSCHLSNSSRESFATCVDGCKNGLTLNALPSHILNLCETLEEDVRLPHFLQHTLELFGRQFDVSSVAPPESTPSVTVTMTLTLPWGEPATTSTKLVGGTLIVGVGVQETSLSTFITTTTLQAGAAAYTSYFTDDSSYAVTEVIGVSVKAAQATTSSTFTTETSSTASSSSQTSSSSTSQGTPVTTSTGNSTSSGLSSGAKIAIGVVAAVLVIVLIVLIVWLIRRRQKGAHVRRRKDNVPVLEYQSHDGNLPEAMSNINELGVAPAYQKHPTQPPSGVAEVENKEIQGNPHIAQSGGQKHEMYSQTILVPEADGTVVHELNETPQVLRHELTATGLSPGQHVARQPSPINRKPVSTPSTSKNVSFPAPWESSAEQDFAPSATLGDTGAAVGSIEDEEARQLEAELVQIREEQERLQRIQELKSREEELKRTLEGKRRGPRT